MLDICILGTGGMMPLPGRWLSSALIRYNGKMILVDCGEGTQITLRNVEWGFKSIEAICVTHFHADHIAGLPGLLLTIGNSGREENLKIIGPRGLNKVVECLTYISPQLPFSLDLIEVEEDAGSCIDVSGISLEYLMLDHNIPCYGYSFNIKRPGKFDVDKANRLSVPQRLWSKLQKGEEIEHEGKIYRPDMVLGDERKGLKISYCTDTRPTEGMVEFIKDSDIFVCEGMYGEDDKIQKAIEKKHMLFKEAAQLARQGHVKEMWLTHYSPSLENPDEFLENAAHIFPNTLASKDLMKKTLRFED
ncbi:MAG TPA: ribonuclease Z [Pseudobacteroides sp.]|uniref:ribonuclease Z n=1 Tax=Pseudobacteroides sp. TaxID=1968840 RepID=UPI002F94AEE5